MKAVALTRYLPIEHTESLIDVELPPPSPGPHDLVVRVKAVSVNPVDAKVRAPKDKVETSPRVIGWDAAGVVEAVGPAATRFRAGDEVYYAGSIIRPGANSELHAVDERIVGRKPARLSFTEAAALPLTALTAWEALFDRLGVVPGATRPRTILIIGGAGGVGSIAIQLARWAGLRVVATASRPESREWVRKMGAHVIVDHRQPLGPQLEAEGLKGADYIANFHDTDAYWTAMGELINPQGRIVSIVETKGPLDLGPLMKKSATFSWELMFTRSMFGTEDLERQHEILSQVSRMIDAGLLATTATETLTPIDARNLRAAHQKLESGRTIGKIVLGGW